MAGPDDPIGDERRERLRLESILGDALPRFVSVPADDIDRAIVETQRRFVEALDIDRSDLFSPAPGDDMVLSHSWHRPGAPPAELGLSAARFLPWCLGRVRRGEEVIFASVRDLPAEAATDLDGIRQFGPRSTVAFPLLIGGRPCGAVTFAAVRAERRWPDRIVERLRLVASVFANALSRKHASEAVRESESRLTLAADSADAGLWTLDAAGHIWGTPKAYEIYGIPDATPLTLDAFLGVVHPDDRGLVRDAVAGSAADGRDFQAEYRIVRPADAAVRWVVARGRPHPATLTHGWRLTGVSIDITDRKRVEEELTRSLAEIKQLKDRLEAESNYLSQEIKSAHGHDRIVGQSAAIRRSLAQVELVAAANTTVLLLGETGTGKELFASAIHETSPRRDRTMVRINCAAMPVALIESELFGREKGAYTGALSRQVGRFELAHRSTLFLDEVGELPLELQVKLLRVLEERQIERLGSPRPIPVDIRLVAATNRDLERAVAEGKFREDLYYRLNVFQIRVPPLRDRRDDIPLLVRAFVGEFAGAQGKRIDSVDQADMAALQQYDWPGNVRELRNVIERAVITAAGPKLRVDPPAARPGPPDGRGLSLRMEDVERAHLTAVLERTGWRIRGDGGAAELLDLKPTTLESRMEKLGIVRPR